MLHYITIIILIIINACVWYVTKQYSYWKNLNIPYIEPTFPYGTLKSKTNDNIIYIVQEQYKKFKGKSLFAGIFFFISPIALAIDLDFIKNIFVKDFNYFPNRGLYYNENEDPLTAHLLNIEDDKWKNMRAKLTPTFTSGKMKFMFPTMIQVAEEFKKCLIKEINKNEQIEMKDLLARFTTDIIGSCAFGIECNTLKDADSIFRNMAKKPFDNPKNSRLMQVFMGNYPNLARKLKMTILWPDVSEFFLNVVNETIKYRDENNIKRNDFIDILNNLKTKGDGLTIKQIAAQSYVFFLAGFETSSTTMGFSLYELAMNPEIQERGRKEIQTILEKYDGNMCYEAIMEMKYLEQIINESLRKYPPVVNVIRKTKMDYAVPNTNYTIEKGIRVLIPIYAIHHDPEYYPNPEEFDPDRFSDEISKTRNSYSFIPFGEGPRICIGLRFGLMQAKIGLATLLLNFRFKIGNKTKVPLTFRNDTLILTNEGGLWLDIENI